MDTTGKKLWKCIVCGEILESDEQPLKCPVCGAGEESIIPYEPEAETFVSIEPLNILILGSGTAAYNAAAEIRARNTIAKITMISREPFLPYFRPTITKKIAQNVSGNDVLIKPRQWYDENRISVLLNTTVSAISPADKTVTLENGEVKPYDRLLIALGASSFMIPVPGNNLPEVIALREYTDVERLRGLLGDTPKKITLIGGGLLGLETAWSLCRLAHEVTVLEALPVILPRQIDPEGAPMLLSKISAACKVITGAAITSIDGSEHVKSVTLKDGTVIPSDIVIVSAGVRCNFQLAEAAGLTVDRGILVNERMHTSDPAIFAAGDCAVCNGRFDGLWETAIQQGKVAGANMVGDTSQVFMMKKAAGATFFAFGTTLFTAGDIGCSASKSYETISARNEIRKTYKKFFFADNKMTGGVLLGDVSQTPLLLKGVNEEITSDEAFDIGIK